MFRACESSKTNTRVRLCCFFKIHFYLPFIICFSMVILFIRQNMRWNELIDISVRERT